tara:strand:+ start:295 stop:2025 length:1731 start_codon:yes stop_codon:yes gene_type:complete
MTKEVFEDMQPAGAAGGAKDKLEKQARQLAYDTKYKVKQAMAAKSGGKMDPAAVQKAYLAQLSKSPAPPAVKALAKKKLLGEEYVNIDELVQSSVVNAVVKVFHEGIEKKEEVIEEDKSGEKFYVKVKDKKTGNTYRRYATRAKIAELRSNPNIESVEMTHHGEEGEKKAKKDYDGDGKVESGSKEHAGAVHNAIQRSKGGTPDGQDTRKEEIEISEAEESKIGGGNLKKLASKAAKRIDADVDGDVDTDDPKSDEMGEFIPSADGKKKIKPKVQREEFYSWRDEISEDKDEDEKEINVMKGKNKVKVMPTLGEGTGEVCDKCGKSPCECDKKEGEEDPRGMKTKVNLVRNKLRAMGLKMSHVPEGELVEARDDQEKQQRDAEKDQKDTLQNIKKITGKKQRLDKEKYSLQKKGKLPLNMSNEIEGDDLQENPLAVGAAIGVAAGGAVLAKKAYDAAKSMKQKRNEKLKGLNNSFEAEGESIEERTRYAKETGKDPQTGKPSVKGGDKPPAAFAKVSADLRKTGGMMSSRKKPIQPQGKKKEKGKKGYQGVTPVDKIKGKLARKRAPKPDIGSRFD